MSEENTTSFYQRNKIIIWVLILIMLGIIIYLVLNKGSGDDPTVEPTPSNIVVSISPKDSVTVGVGYSTYLFAMVDSDPNASFSWKSSIMRKARPARNTFGGNPQYEYQLSSYSRRSKRRP